MQCTQPNNRLLPRVNQLIDKFFKLGLLAVITFIGYRIRTRTTVIVTVNPTARIASISSSAPSVAFKPSGHPFSEKRHNTVFVVNPLFDLGMNSLTIRPFNSLIAGSDLVPNQQSYYQIDMRYTSSLLQYRSPYGSIRYYGNTFSCRSRLVAAVSPQHSIQKAQKAAKYLRLPPSITQQKQNAVLAAIKFFEKEATARYPALDLNFPSITELNDGTIVVLVNGHTSVDRYGANKLMNVNLKSFIERMLTRNPALFNEISLSMQRSEADHLFPTNFSTVLGINRDAMSTVLLDPADHATKDSMKKRYKRPVTIEDMVDWMIYINGETKNHFFTKAMAGDLTSDFDVNKFDKALDKCVAHDIELFKTTQFYHSEGTGQTSDMLRILDASTANVKARNINLYNTGESGDNELSRYKLARNMVDFFTKAKEVAAFCYTSEVEPRFGCFTTRVPSKIAEFRNEAFIYFSEGCRRLGPQVKNDPAIMDSYHKFEDILKGKGEYNDLISTKSYENLLFNGRDPFYQHQIAYPGASNVKQKSDRKVDVPKVN